MFDQFVFVDELVSGIRWDAKYATWDNFTGKPVDGYFANRIVGTRALCAALEQARDRAASWGFGLLLWDGYRPQRAVDCFVRWSEQPEDGRTKPRHYPNIDRATMFENGYVAAKSGHSRGSTVDLTLYQLTTGDLAPMGGDHDLMDPISHHGARGISQLEGRNRRYLCSIMEDCGFRSYQCEWWHYTLGREPYPDTYFDFPIASVEIPVESDELRSIYGRDDRSTRCLQWPEALPSSLGRRRHHSVDCYEGDVEVPEEAEQGVQPGLVAAVGDERRHSGCEACRICSGRLHQGRAEPFLHDNLVGVHAGHIPTVAHRNHG